MNRAQRRKLQRDKNRNNISVQGSQAAHTDQPDFSGVPLATMCQSIQMLINELNRRGFPVYDFDNKAKYVQGIQIIKGKVYFLAAEEETRP